MKKIYFLLFFWVKSLFVYGQTYDLENEAFGYSIQIPEVQELLFVVFALTENGQKNDMLLDKKSVYYQDVMRWFGKYSHEKVVRNVNKKVDAYYNHFKMDACKYQFDSQNQLVKQSDYANFSWGNKDFIKPLRADLAEFAFRTNFRQFYKAHQDYYAMLIAQMELQSPILKQKKWLDAHFKTDISRYFIYFSPLSRGLHSTNYRFAQKNKTVLVWVSSPFLIEDNQYSAAEKEGLITRMVFTEIDHNYINPLSDKHLKAIKIAFRHRKIWASGGFTKSYTNPYSVWNEYMTWGVYLLYAKERFTPENYHFVSTTVIDKMEKNRGFVLFGKFYTQLLVVYTKNQDIENCYPAMLEWAKNEHK